MNFTMLGSDYYMEAVIQKGQHQPTSTHNNIKRKGKRSKLAKFDIQSLQSQPLADLKRQELQRTEKLTIPSLLLV